MDNRRISTALIITGILIVVLIATYFSMKNNNFSTESPTRTLSPEQQSKRITLTYSELSRQQIGEDTRLVLSITARYNSGTPTTLNHNKFVLDILIPAKAGFPSDVTDKSGEASPLETGNLTVSKNNEIIGFRLTFQFKTVREGADTTTGLTDFTDYLLRYSGDPYYIIWVKL